MEDALSSKFNEFMTALDHVKKYRALLSALPDFAIIITLSIILALFTMILNHFNSVYVSQSSGSVLYNYFIIFSFIGILIGIYWVNRKIKSVKVGQWKEQLNEGLPGVIKLLQELNWDNTFSDIRHAKLGSWLYGITKILVYWILAVIVFFNLTNWLQNIFHFGTSGYVVEVFSLVFVLILSKKDLCNRYNQIGRLDMLFWELRWFESEYRRADFEA